MNSAAFQRRNEVVLGRVNVYTMHGSRQERLYLNKKPQTGMKWLFTRPENPKFNTSASTEREVQWAMVAISTQCSCSSQSIFYAIKNWEFGGRTPTHIFSLPLFVFPVFLFQLLKSTFSWFFRQWDWDYPDLTNNEVVGGFQPIQTLSSSSSCFHYDRWAQLSMGRTFTQALPTTSTEK